MNSLPVTPSTSAKPSALETLRALANKKAVASSPGLSAQCADPAIAGAKRDKNTVKLGFDPSFTLKAATAADLKAALERAAADFEILQAEVRDYGKAKRASYNSAFKTTVTTVCIPYSVETPEGPETKYVQVVCSNKYSINADLSRSKDELVAAGAWDKLFVEEVTKKLKPNAEELIRGVLEQCGFAGDELESVVDTLFETSVKVKTVEDYESEAEKVTPAVRAVLDQMVTRVSPGLKFSL